MLFTCQTLPPALSFQESDVKTVFLLGKSLGAESIEGEDALGVVLKTEFGRISVCAVV